MSGGDGEALESRLTTLEVRQLAIMEHIAKHDEQLDEHDDRISAQERFKAWLTGLGVTTTAVGGTILAVARKKLGWD